MRRAWFCVALLSALLPASARAGGIDSLMNQRVFSIAEVNLNLGTHVARLYEEDKPDSVSLLLREWEDRVGYNGMIQKFDSLWNIEQGVFSSKDIDEDFYERLVGFRMWADEVEHLDTVTAPRELLKQMAYSERYEEVTSRMALRSSLGEEPDSDAQLVALAYQNQFEVLGRRMHSPLTEGTAMRREYDAALQRFFDRWDSYFTIQTGYWKGGGGLEQMGGHPLFGMSMRGISRRFYFGLSFALQPGDASQDFEFRVDGRRVRTDRFVGLEGFLDVGMHLIRSERHTWSAFVGPGVAGFRGFYGDADPPDREDFFAPALSFGTTYRWRYHEFSSGSIVVNARYTMGNYEGADDSEFHGNSFALEVGWGFQAPDPYHALRYYK